MALWAFGKLINPCRLQFPHVWNESSFSHQFWVHTMGSHCFKCWGKRTQKTAELSPLKVKVVSNSLRPHGLYSPWESPGQSTAVGSLSLLQGIFPTQGSNPGLPHCRQILYSWATREAPLSPREMANEQTGNLPSVFQVKVKKSKPGWGMMEGQVDVL